jgi:2,3-bisphosphoglycerate-dependent phosphoglycerate mutase
MKNVFLIRHAHAHYDSAIPDPRRPLSELGRRQAAELAGLVAHLGIEEIHTSPYERCLHTIQPLAESLGLRPRHVHELRERTFTDQHVPDWAATWETAWMDPDFAFPDGESGRSAQSRIFAAVEAIVAASAAETLAVSSHGNVIALLLQQIDPDFGFEHACGIRNPDVFRVTFDHRGLQWDREFRLDALARIATTFQTSSEA